ncbi:MAG: host-nuclease inhibitor Gam family protein [Proteobacteria bacterium]|nr:host-nuclease inhibitor Gam family protein [Pseudomonadota bacterium]
MTTVTTPLADIEAEAKLHEQARLLLAERVGAYQQGLAALARDQLPGIRRALNKAADIEARLRALVQAHPQSFAKPRTLVMHGTKIGYQKTKPRLGIDKPARVLERIKRLMPERAELLIHKEEKPNKEALAKLPEADLQRLGCKLTAGNDEVIVKAVDGAVEKMVQALLKEASDALTEGEDEGGVA